MENRYIYKYFKDSDVELKVIKAIENSKGVVDDEAIYYLIKSIILSTTEYINMIKEYQVDITPLNYGLYLKASKVDNWKDL